jgi:hypothetical protein
MKHDDRPTLADLAANPVLAAEVDLDHIPELLREMDRLRAILWARLAVRINRPHPKKDRLLGVGEATARLGISKDWLYRKSDRLSFAPCGCRIDSFATARRGSSRAGSPPHGAGT